MHRLAGAGPGAKHRVERCGKAAVEFCFETLKPECEQLVPWNDSGHAHPVMHEWIETFPPR